MSIIQEKAQRERELAKTHRFLGRISNYPDSCVTFCACGLAFYGKDVVEADNRHRVHEADATGGEVTCWSGRTA